jgi:hypothetical protein
MDLSLQSRQRLIELKRKIQQSIVYKKHTSKPMTPKMKSESLEKDIAGMWKLKASRQE